MITCRDVARMATDYLEDAVNGRTKTALFLHLLFCPSCRRHINKMKQLVAVLGQLPPNQQAPDGFIEDVLAAVGSSSTSSPPSESP